MTLDPVHLITLLGMAAVTLLFRVGGYVLVRYVTPRGRVKVAMEAMPAAVLTALVVPMALTTGIAETLAALVTVLAVLRLPLIVAVCLGTGTVVLFRTII
ncbi:MAG: AzlD domain-containing protein [Alphaproteobacteria bacterium]|nr:AzlD domain-containing protein [Alphaproteobacteria bacterium]